MRGDSSIFKKSGEQNWSSVITLFLCTTGTSGSEGTPVTPSSTPRAPTSTDEPRQIKTEPETHSLYTHHSTHTQVGHLDRGHCGYECIFIVCCSWVNSLKHTFKWQYLTDVHAGEWYWWKHKELKSAHTIIKSTFNQKSIPVAVFSPSPSVPVQISALPAYMAVQGGAIPLKMSPGGHSGSSGSKAEPWNNLILA